jgi:hypothetical protein
LAKFTNMACLRIIVTGLLALALAVGPGWKPCLAFQHRVADEALGALVSHHGHAYRPHEIAADHIVSAVSDTTRTDKERDCGDENICVKCCAACILTSILPRSVVISAPTELRVVFVWLNARAPGRIVFVDPDIPKSVA